MPTKKQIADTLRGHLSDVAERGRFLGQALKVRADMAATRRRLRTTYAELGEETYGRLSEGQLEGDHRLLSLKERIDGLRAEVWLRETELRDIMHAGVTGSAKGADDGDLRADAAKDAGEGAP